MLTVGELRALMTDRESDRVELTVSTKNTDKFGEAICAFANDFPNHRQPGCLIVGVGDDGTVSGLSDRDRRAVEEPRGAAFQRQHRTASGHDRAEVHVAGG